MILSFHMFWTVTLLLVFAGIVYWAWNDRRKEDFEEASRLPLDDDPNIDTKQEDNHNG